MLGSFLIKLHAFRLAIFLKETPRKVFPVDIARFLRRDFL